MEGPALFSLRAFPEIMAIYNEIAGYDVAELW
jgi:hypothetical protein